MGFLYLSSLLLLLSSYCLASSSKGCGSSLPGGLKPGGPSELLDLESQGNNRTYLVHLPKNYDINTPAPLILGYHGNGEDAYNQESISQMSEAQWDRGYLVVYPNGVGKHWQGADYATPNVSDLQFTNDLISELESSFCVDSSRVYATGKSNGGGFVGLMTCDQGLSSRIKAFAPVAGAFYWQLPDAKNCTPAGPVPIMEFHGDADPVISPWGGEGLGGELPSIPSWISNKARLDNCPNPSTPDNTELLNAGQVVKETWYCGNKNPILVRFNETQMVHAWPGGPEQNGTDLAPATPNILDFFAQW